MKTTSLILSLALSTAVFADFESWTSSDGRTATMDLQSVQELDGEMVGTFRLRNGKTVQLKASELNDDGATKMKDWKDPAAAAAAGPESVFDDTLEGNLLRLDDKTLVRCDDATQPQKFYVFYYTASWCPPCRAFTPTLVKWYEDNKNDNFELVLISSDRSEDAMVGYAAKNKMPWPQLDMKKAQGFKGKFDHGVRGIPSLIVCDLEGKNMGNFRGNLGGLTDLVAE